MRIVTKQDFYKLPAGTIFCEYDPYILGRIKLKEETLYDDGNPWDFYEVDLTDNVDGSNSEEIAQILENAENTGEPFDLDFETPGRDGLFDEKQLYAVYEEKDLRQLIEVLQKAIK